MGWLGYCCFVEGLEGLCDAALKLGIMQCCNQHARVQLICTKGAAEVLCEVAMNNIKKALAHQ